MKRYRQIYANRRSREVSSDEDMASAEDEGENTSCTEKRDSPPKEQEKPADSDDSEDSEDESDDNKGNDSDNSYESDSGSLTDSERGEKPIQILPIGKCSVFWEHFGFTVDWQYDVRSHAEVRCKLCNRRFKMNCSIVHTMQKHLEKCRPSIHAALSGADDPQRHMSVVPSAQVKKEHELDRYDSEDRDADDLSDKDSGDESFLKGVTSSKKKMELKRLRNGFLYCVRKLKPDYFEHEHTDISSFAALFGGMRIQNPDMPQRLEHLRVRDGPGEDEVLDLLPEKCAQVKAKLKKKLETASEYSIGIEGWNWYFTVSVNYLEGPVLRNSILFTRHQKYRKESMLDRPNFIKYLETEWGLKKQKISAVVTEVELVRDKLEVVELPPNLKKELPDPGQFLWEQQLQAPVIPCFADFLNQLVCHKLFSMKEIREQIRENVHFLHDNKFAPDHKNEECFDIYYRKLKFGLRNFEDWELPPSKLDYFYLHQLATLLHTMRIVQDTAREEHPYGMVSTLWPILHKMLTELFVPKDDDQTFTKKMKEVIINFTKKHYSKVLPFLQAATMLDPRFRTMYRSKENAEEVNKIIFSMAGPLQTVDLSAPSGSRKRTHQSTDVHAQLRAELSKFLSQRPADYFICPIKWWLNEGVQKSYPLLKEVAKKFNCIPSSRIPQQRLIKDTIYDERLCLGFEPDDWLFLWSNYRLIEF